MALRPGLVRRFLSTSIFTSRPTASAASAFSSDSNTNSNNAAAEPNPTLFVSGLNKRTTSEKLNEAFAKFGEVVTARVVTDRATGFSKGYGFVTYSTLDDAEKGIKGMDAQNLDGWIIFTEFSRPRRTPGQSAYLETYTTAS